MHDGPDDSQSRGPWTIDEPTITTLIVLAPAANLLDSPESLTQALADTLGRAVDLSTPDQLPEHVPWVAVLEVDDLPAPLICWPEANAAEGTGLEDDLPSPAGLIVQTVLHPDDPLTCMANVLRLLSIAGTGASGILDADTGRWLPFALLQKQIVQCDIEPSEELLWIVEATDQDDVYTMQTCGLERCGHRELAMNGLAASQLDTAADLVASLAALVLETALPESGTIEIGPGLHLRIGGDPSAENAVVELSHAERNGPPDDVLERLEDDIAAVYRSERSTARRTALASSTWDRLLDLHSTLIEAGATCYVEVPFEDSSGQDDRRIHLWMEITERRDAIVMAIPAHEARELEGLSEDPITVEADEICSWRVVLDEEAWGPEQCEMLIERFANDS